MTGLRTIPFFNYAALYLEREEEIIETLRDVMGRGAFILQQDLRDFEAKLRALLDVKYAYGLADGTNALILGLRAAGIGPGDEVVVPSHTYVASAASIHFVGAQPVCVEIGPDHMVDPESVERAITSRTRAMMPVHINGRTCDMDPLQDIARRHDILIVEDAAQALGSKYKGRCAGTFGAFGTFSFYPAKLLGCFGDGGALVTNDDAIAEQVGLLRDHGRNADGRVVAWGTNCRLDNIQAAVLSMKLKYYEDEIARRRSIASRYDAAFKDIDDITLPPGPDENADHFDIYQNYELEAGRRDELRRYLDERGVKTVIQWAGTPVHQFEELGLEADLPVTDRFFERCFMLPLYPALGDDEVEYICGAVRAFYGAGG